MSGREEDGGSDEGEIAGLLRAHREGEPGAFDRLFSLVYDDLRSLAHRQLSSQSRHRTLATTALVHEAYLKLSGAGGTWTDKGHFTRVAAVAMRHIVIDLARERLTRKRGGGRTRVDLDTVELAVDRDAEQIVAIDQALGRLRDLHPRLVQVVECRYFAGLADVETADALGVSTRTVERDWKRARAWLKVEVGGLAT